MHILVSRCKVLCLVVLLVLNNVGVAQLFKLKGNTSTYDEGEAKEFHRHTVVSNGPECGPIGMTILKEHNGTAVDAAIAILLCEGVTVCQSMGLGGGFVATLYNKFSGKVETIIARERAPLASTENMFENMTSVRGILSVAVPGELKGYSEMHKKYGRAPWKTLIQPTIDLCRSGHIVTEYLAKYLQEFREEIFAESSLREIFVNPETNDVWEAGDRMRQTKLADTLEIIANEGADAMYTASGTIANMLVEEIQELGGILTLEDFVSYEAEWKTPISMKLQGGHSLHSVPLPASGMVLSLILNILSGFKQSYSVDYVHQIIESFKYGYAQRTHLGDLPFNQSFIDKFTDMKFADELRSYISTDRTYNDYRHYQAEYAFEEDHGTAHISVLTENGDAVSVTSTINNIFGSLIRSKSTGIILNDQMDDFASPGIKNNFGLEPSPANFIRPGKRPQSSMCPLIVLNKDNDVVLVLGSAGGSRITSTVAYIFARHFWLNETLKDAVFSKRIHHQLLPMEAIYEEGFDADILEGLRQKGHNTIKNLWTSFTTATAISRLRGFVEALPDPRAFPSSFQLETDE